MLLAETAGVRGSSIRHAVVSEIGSLNISCDRPGNLVHLRISFCFLPVETLSIRELLDHSIPPKYRRKQGIVNDPREDAINKFPERNQVQ